MIFHEVKSGETLSQIARNYGTSVASLVAYNGIPNPEALAVGQCIVIVYPELLHTVRAGDTIFSIALQYGISVNQIYRNNPQLSSLPNLYPGEVLVIELEDDRIASFETGGYAYPDTPEELLRAQMPFMNYFMPFTYGFTFEGTLTNPTDEKLITLAHRYGRKCFLHLSTLTDEGYFSNEIASVILNNQALTDTLIDNILQEVTDKGFDGVDIDFEFVYSQDAYKYAEFVEKLRVVMNVAGYEVFVALAPKTSDDQKGLLYEGHLYRELGQAANAVLLMTYEWGYT